VAVSLLAVIGYLVFTMFTVSTRGIGIARARTIALGIANEQLEIFHNLPYADVGTINGTVPGLIPQTQTVNRDTFTFTVESEALFIDDPFDGDVLGTIVGKPVDTEPADYKRVEVRVCWNLFPCVKPVRLTTTIAPNGLESQPNTGSLILHVFDASGLPVPQADVRLRNDSLSIDSNHTTDTDGNLALLSLPPALNSYNITITKNGFSSDYTLPATLLNPNPLKPDTSVLDGGVTEISFAIDLVSTFTVKTIDLACNPIADINFRLYGQKLDYQAPDVRKYDQSPSTDAGGNWSTSSLEWDNYTFQMLSAGYDIAGSDYPFSIPVLPQSSITMSLNLVPDAADTLRVTVKDSTSGGPLSNASVHLTQAASGYDQTVVTGQGSWTQNDWVGGGGQADWTDQTKYWSDDGNVDTSVAGQLTLATTDSDEYSEETFQTTTNQDSGQTTANWDTSGAGHVQLADDSLNPGQYLASGIAQSTTLNPTSGKIITATLNALSTLNGQTIDYFLTSDGLTFEPVIPGVAHTFAITGNDLRWQAVLATTDTAVTPTLEQITIDYTLQTFQPAGRLESSTFNAGAGSNFNFLRWTLVSQPPATGTDSVRFQVASKTTNGPWMDADFHGPDGTSATYFTSANEALTAGDTNQQYIRYRVYLQTADGYATPLVSDATVIHSAGCLPSGQVFFTPLTAGDYNLEVSLSGYDTYTTTVTVSGDTAQEITLTPSP